MDKIEISISGFGSPAGFGNPGTVVISGTTAHAPSDHLLYDSGTGILWFDADGNGSGRAIAFAQFANKPVLDGGDFTFVL